MAQKAPHFCEMTGCCVENGQKGEAGRPAQRSGSGLGDRLGGVFSSGDISRAQPAG